MKSIILLKDKNIQVENPIFRSMLTDFFNFEQNISSLFREKIINETSDLSHNEKYILLTRTIQTALDTLVFNQDPILSFFQQEQLNLIQKLAQNMNIEEAPAFFTLLQHSIPMGKPHVSDFINKIKKFGVDENSVIFPHVKNDYVSFDKITKTEKIIDICASVKSQLSLFDSMLDEKTFNNKPGILSLYQSLSMDKHPEVIDNFLKQNKLVHLGDNFKTFHDVFSFQINRNSQSKEYQSFNINNFHNDSYFDSISNFEQFHQDLLNGQYDKELTHENNIENLLFHSFTKNVFNTKKEFQNVVAVYKNKNVNISSKQKESLLCIIIQKNSFNDIDTIPWNFNINNKKALFLLLQNNRYSITKKFENKYTYKSRHISDKIFEKNKDDIKTLLQDKNIRQIIENNIIENFKEILSENRIEQSFYSPKDLIDFILDIPLYNLIINSEYSLSPTFFESLSENINNINIRAKPEFIESLKIHIEIKYFTNEENKPTKKKRI